MKTILIIIVGIIAIAYFQKDILAWYHRPDVQQAMTGATILAKVGFSNLMSYFQHVASTTPSQ